MNATPRIHVLQERNMQWYLGTQLFSLTGYMLRNSLISLLIIDLIGLKNAPPIVGIVWALNVLPGTFLGIPAGMFLDSHDKRRVLQVTALLGMIQAGALAYYSYGNIHQNSAWKTIWELMAVTLFTGFTNAIDGIGRNAIVKDAIVNEYNHRLGGILFNSLYTFAMVVGNGISGFLVLSIGYSNSFILNGLSFVVLLVGLYQMNFDHRPKPVKNPKGVWQLMKEGGSYTFNQAGIRICIILAATIVIFGYTYNVTLSIIAKEMFQGGPKEYSYLAAVAGFGSLVGSITVVLWNEKRPKTFVVVGCLIIGIAFIAFSRTTNIHHGAVLLFFCGFGFMASFLSVRGAIMHIVDRKLVGIVLGYVFTFFFGGMMISSLCAGYLTKHFGSPAVLATCGVILLITGIATPFLPGIKEIGDDDVGNFFSRRLKSLL